MGKNFSERENFFVARVAATAPDPSRRVPRGEYSSKMCAHGKMCAHVRTWAHMSAPSTLDSDPGAQKFFGRDLGHKKFRPSRTARGSGTAHNRKIRISGPGARDFPPHFSGEPPPKSARGGKMRSLGVPHPFHFRAKAGLSRKMKNPVRNRKKPISNSS